MRSLCIILWAQQMVSEKVCNKCKCLKLLEKFPYSGYTRDSRYSYCKECANNKNHHNYAKRTGRTIEEVKIAKANRAVKIVDGKKRCCKCNQTKPANNFSKDNNAKCGLFPSCKSCANKAINAYAYKETRRIKLICMMGYGGRCVCCGDNRIEMLTIEHIRYKGHNLIYCQTTTLMKELIRLNFPEGYTVLCWGCNQLTKHDKPCTHSEEWSVYYKKNIELFNYSRQKELDELEHKWGIMK